MREKGLRYKVLLKEVRYRDGGNTSVPQIILLIQHSCINVNENALYHKCIPIINSYNKIFVFGMSVYTIT